MALTDNKICIVCSITYLRKLGVKQEQWNKSKCCSRKCFNSTKLGKKLTEEHKNKIAMGNIGRVFTEETRIKISKSNKGRKISEDTRKKLRESHMGQVSWNKGIKWIKNSGENHPQWKGGNSKRYKDGYYSFEYKQWRKMCMERDGFKCMECGEKGYLTVHHIKSFKNYPELRFELLNGVTLCEECHSKTDNYKGRNKKILNNQL